ncbi:MAG: hypothetical protein M3R40_10410 [Pseudomonadota bacterium]|nr:hypothetical protein [Pseudomonadota bacterium]
MASNPPHALRLTFAYRGTQISVAGSERIAMIVPNAIETPQAGQAGYWFTLLDAAGRVVYQRPLHNPIRTDVEAYSPGKGQAIVRVPLAAREGQFTVLVPDLDDAQTFQLHGPADPDRPGEPAGELLRLDIGALRKANLPPGPGGTPPRQGTTG